MRSVGPILSALAALLVGCSPFAETGLTKQEVEDIAKVVMQQTTNTLVGMQRGPNGDVTVWTAPLNDGTNGVGEVFTVRAQEGGWAVVGEKSERLNE
jgi:hypothetical protein